MSGIESANDAGNRLFEGLSTEEIIAGLGEQQRIELLTAMIEELPKGYKPLPVFNALARTMVLATVELVPLRTNPETNETEVLLTQRPENDTWADEWHVPGCALLASDSVDAAPEDGGPYRDAFGRLMGDDGELRSGVRPTFWPPQELRTERRKVRRGPELSVVHYIEVEGEPKVGVFVPVNSTFEQNAPDDGVIIRHHVPFIIAAARAYEQRRAEMPAQ